MGRGSSPLARGLRGGGGGGGGGDADHPRSRGVYSDCRGGFSTHLGSSPLARGLLRGLVAEHGMAGIIPARAGFTSTGPLLAGGGRDHPRSRGVYQTKNTMRMVRAGSSPLARGLLLGRPCTSLCGRIIPARAGFTRGLPPVDPWYPDHPRSRGVYEYKDSIGGGGQGSSPLARGLPDVRQKLADASGIIPARAGFTTLARRMRTRLRDHPRSRGVYCAK